MTRIRGKTKFRGFRVIMWSGLRRGGIEGGWL